MKPNKRREALQTAGAAAAGVLAGCATPASGRGDPRTVFDVPDTLIPIVGSDAMFPVRRI